MNRRGRRILMTIDAVGGVWRYAMDLAEGLAAAGDRIVFAGLGPRPSEAQRAEAERLGPLEWLDLPLDWTADDEAALHPVPQAIAVLADRHDVDLLHLNLPSQAHRLEIDRPVVVVSHSCVVSWFRAVRASDTPPDWAWQARHNRAGFARADAVLAPSRSHAALLERCYGPLDRLEIVPNASSAAAQAGRPRRPVAVAAARWWDDGKNGRDLDAAAALSRHPVLMAGATRGPNGQGIEIAHATALGELTGAAVRDLMASAAVVVSPSIYEPFGLVPLEAARAGAALVLADIPTYRELWDDAAVFAPPGDPAAFAAAIDGLMADPARRDALANSARRRSLRFTIAAQVRAVRAVHDRISQPTVAPLAEVSL